MRILEISESAAAGYAGCLLAALGSDATGGPQVEVVRLAGNTDSANSGHQSAGGELFLHHQKVTAVPATPKVKTASVMQAREFDVLLEDVGSAGLKSLGWSYRRLRAANPNLVIVSLSPFGRKGAYSRWSGNDFLAQAAGGVMHTCGYDGEAPLALPGEAAFMIAGLHGATAALAAYHDRHNSDGVHIDISAQDTFFQHFARHVSEYIYCDRAFRRESRRPEGLHQCHTAMAQDGWLYLLALREPWQDLAAFLGLGDRLQPEAFEVSADQPPWSEMEEPFHKAIASKSKYEWFSQAAELGWTFAPIEDPFAIAKSPQVAARGGMEIARDHDDVQMPPLPWIGAAS